MARSGCQNKPSSSSSLSFLLASVLPRHVRTTKHVRPVAVRTSTHATLGQIHERPGLRRTPISEDARTCDIEEPK